MDDRKIFRSNSKSAFKLATNKDYQDEVGNIIYSHKNVVIHDGLK